MKRKQLGLVHTTATLVPLFQQLCSAKLPGVEVVNVVDEMLIKDVLRHDGLTPHNARRVVRHVIASAEGGADLVMVTCSSLGRAVEAAAMLVSVPVLRVDLPMAEKAVQTGKRIGVIATVRATMEPTADLISRRAQKAGKQIELTSRLCEGAFDAWMRGDMPKHDAIVVAALKELSQQVEVIVLAQVSMARVVDGSAADDKRVPILASPSLAVDYLATVL